MNVNRRLGETTERRLWKYKGRVIDDAAFSNPSLYLSGSKGSTIYRSASVKLASFSNSSMSESGRPFVVDG